MKRIDTAKMRALLDSAEVDGPEYVAAFDAAMRVFARDAFDEIDQSRALIADLERAITLQRDALRAVASHMRAEANARTAERLASLSAETNAARNRIAEVTAVAEVLTAIAKTTPQARPPGARR